jgi:hypothetical protein
MSSNKFWDLDDLLMSNEIIPCEADIDIYGLEQNEFQTKNDKDELYIPEKTKIECPLWIALLFRQANCISINTPKYLSDKFYHTLLADPAIINFKNKNNFFYEICMSLIPYLDEENKWAAVLVKALYKRLIFLNTNSVNVEYEDQHILKISCLKEKYFYDKAVKINRSTQYYLSNYLNNNKNFEEIMTNRSRTQKKKKNN